MKIKKTLFSTEIEITPDEINGFYSMNHPRTVAGLFCWLKDNFNLDLFSNDIINKKK